MRTKNVPYFRVGTGSLSNPGEFTGMRCEDTYTPKSIENGDIDSSDGMDESFTLRQLWQECVGHSSFEVCTLGNGNIRIAAYHEGYVSDYRKGEEKQESIHCTLSGPAGRAFIWGCRVLGVIEKPALG